MLGLPKYLNTAEDYANAHALALAGDAPARQAMLGHWQALLDTDKYWQYQEAVSADYVPAAGERVMVDEQLEGQTYSLFREVDNPESPRRQLGFSVEDVQARIAELGGE